MHFYVFSILLILLFLNILSIIFIWLRCLYTRRICPLCIRSCYFSFTSKYVLASTTQFFLRHRQTTTFKTNYFLTNLHFAAKKHSFPSPLLPATKQNKKGISPRPWTALADVCACTCPYYAVTYKTNNLIIYSPTIIP